MYRTYDLYCLVLRAISNLSAVYLYYCAALTQIIRAPCSAEAIGDRHRYPPPAAPQEPMVAPPFRCLLTSVCPTPVPPMSHPVHLYHAVHPYVPYSQWPASVSTHKSRPIRPSRANGDAPVLLPVNTRPSRPLHTNVPSVPSFPFCQLPTNAFNQPKSGFI